MQSHPMRRAQLIAPSGVGSLHVLQDGTIVIVAGLDPWFDPQGRHGTIDETDFKVEEWRLQRLLHVDHFRVPPDYRERGHDRDVPNLGLTIPVLRFPTWHVCPRCHYLSVLPLTARGKQQCLSCRAQGKRYLPTLVQLPLVAVCDHGHIQDINWYGWIHRDTGGRCHGNLRYIVTGASGMIGQQVVCDCGRYIALNDLVNSHGHDGDSSTDYLRACRGERPWLGDKAAVRCGRRLSVTQINASNAYFAQVKSAIYLPRQNSEVPEELLQKLEQRGADELLHMGPELGMGSEAIAKLLKKQLADSFLRYSVEEIAAAVAAKLTEKSDATGATDNESLDEDVYFKYAEYEILSRPQADPRLSSVAELRSSYKPIVSDCIATVMRVTKLQETRVLAGFSRVFPQNDMSLSELKGLLRKFRLPHSQDWLPANVVYGEGVFLTLDSARLAEWESREDVRERAELLSRRYKKVQVTRHLREMCISPRLVLIHTLAHALMNRLIFECGYSAASLRERLYASLEPETPMAGLLLYTAAGDSEGTLGGLVRMGKPGFLEPIVQRALEDATWCSSDPICTEVGAKGQGPDSCNLAACHACSLVPETSCELFNRFLDRALLVREVGSQGVGFFEVAKGEKARHQVAVTVAPQAHLPKGDIIKS